MRANPVLGAIIAALIVAAIGVGTAAAQFDVPRPSPKATVSQVVGLTEVSIAYCRPGVKGRTIWGGLVPYDQVWRTGANEATTITFSTDVTIDGKALTAGTYGLFTIPGKDEWTVIFNKGAKQWGAYEYKQTEDVLRIKVKPKAAPFSERLTFSFPNTLTDATDVAMSWEKLQISFAVKVDVVTKVLADARKALAEAKPDDWRTPLRAAAFCADSNVNLTEALTWADKSIAVLPGYYNTFTKARLLAATGKKADAIALAKKAIELGQKAQPKADTMPAEWAVAEWSGGK
jgi:hypothetical protein